MTRINANSNVAIYIIYEQDGIEDCLNPMSLYNFIED